MRSSSDDEDDSTLSGLELEQFVAFSPRRTPSRTNSGSFLHSRSSSLNRKNNIVSPTASPRTAPSNFFQGRTMARAAYAQLLEQRLRGGDFRMQSPMFGVRGRISCWLASLLGMILLSISLNLFEVSYLNNIFGDSAKAQLQKAGFEAPNTSPGVTGRPGIATAGSQQITTSPTAAPTLPRPFLSVHEHKETILNSNFSSTNTFTTWLDFDDNDPPKRRKHPVVGDEKAFASQWCDLTGTTWYPSNASHTKDTTWQLRAPAFLLPGAAYSGTVYMAAALHQHPSILPARTKELQFFHERPFRRYVSASEKTLVRAARERMFARDYDIATLKKNNTMLSFDATPGYLFYSSLLPRRILCVEPWVKLVLMLRNPVDRVLEHYAASQQRGLKQTLEQWIDQEFALMQKVGLIAAANTTQDPKFFGSKEEDVAWYDYQTASVAGGIGRSMYVVQIRQWIAAFRQVGRDSAEALLIVRTDRVAANPGAEYERVLKFLRLPPHVLQAQKLSMPVTVTHQTRRVSAETRQRLEDFFLPYNRRLKSLMRLYGVSSCAEDDDV